MSIVFKTKLASPEAVVLKLLTLKYPSVVVQSNGCKEVVLFVPDPDSGIERRLSIKVPENDNQHFTEDNYSVIDSPDWINKEQTSTLNALSKCIPPKTKLSLKCPKCGCTDILIQFHYWGKPNTLDTLQSTDAVIGKSKGKCSECEVINNSQYFMVADFEPDSDVIEDAMSLLDSHEEPIVSDDPSITEGNGNYVPPYTRTYNGDIPLEELVTQAVTNLGGTANLHQVETELSQFTIGNISSSLGLAVKNGRLKHAGGTPLNYTLSDGSNAGETEVCWNWIIDNNHSRELDVFTPSDAIKKFPNLSPKSIISKIGSALRNNTLIKIGKINPVYCGANRWDGIKGHVERGSDVVRTTKDTLKLVRGLIEAEKNMTV